MNQEFFTNLPSEIIIDILSRLPVRTIMRCKCVCKSLLYLVETHEFANSHLSVSAPGLAVHMSKVDSDSYKIFEFEDRLNLEYHELHYNLLIKFDFPHAKVIQGSVNGLLLLCDYGRSPNGLYICNPITRDYIELCCPKEFVYSYPQVVKYGFGASKLTNQHKVVRILDDYFWDPETPECMTARLAKSECQVYTLGTGSWRSIDLCPLFEYRGRSAFVNGNLHWLVHDLNGTPWISCFDLEAEVFSTFSPPLPRHKSYLVVCALDGCLCLSERTCDDNEIVIWLMKDYGVDKSWTKEFVISNIFHLVSDDVLYPIKVFRDGDILMAFEALFLFYYSNKTKTVEEVDIFELQNARYLTAILHTPSFFSVKNFTMEDVSSF